ncbi:hypothetical protein E2C01_072312 [Portunus trituberculatus]|uniref:Uncharacterized protein n=1 Tax=Portunus trituberculatus TaxID=210409 RepID=A0A5B7IAV5_PORTR|nr:hypothetical protein [Portunus trituberculatus]
MAETLLRWHSPELQQRVKQAVDAVADIRRQKEKTEAQLVLSLTSAATVTSSSELTSFMGQIKELNDVTGVLVQQEEEVEQLTKVVDCCYTQAAHLAARLYTLMSTLGTLHMSYNVPLSLVQDSISHRLASSNLDDASKQVSQGE